MGAQGNVTWNGLCETWNNCTSQRVWNCFEEIVTYQGGGVEEMDWIQRHSLTNDDKNTIISLYVEVFKDHLTSQERQLLETGGIKLIYVDKAEVNNAIDAVLRSKSIITETIETVNLKDVNRVSLSQLMRMLKIK
jgi:hypothetical protein